MTGDDRPTVRASWKRMPRSRGAMSGFLLLVLGAWAGVVAFVGPYFDLAYTPAPNSSWYWTAARAWHEVAPGAAAFLGGLVLVVSSKRVMTLWGSWLAIAGGAWLVVGPSLAGPIGLQLGTPDPASSGNARAAEALLFFYGIGAAIIFVASMALGRLSVNSVRDLRAAERRAADEQAAFDEQRRMDEQRRRLQEPPPRGRQPIASGQPPNEQPIGNGQPTNGMPPMRGRQPVHGDQATSGDQATNGYPPVRTDQPTRAYTPAPPPEEGS